MTAQRYYPSEKNEQIAVAKYLTSVGACFIHVPNEGKRSPIEGMILKAMGLQAGFPDLLILEPRIKPSGAYIPGLAIEMKTKTGNPSANQKEWIKRLLEKGFACAICHGADEGIKVASDYLKLQKGEPNGILYTKSKS